MDDYVFDEYTEGAERIVRDDQVNKLQEEVTQYQKQIETMQHTLDENLSEVWDAFSDPVALDLESTEQTSIFQLLKTDLKNECIYKSFMVFSNLCLEITKLKDRAYQHFFPMLKLFGEGITIAEPANEGQGQVQFATMLPFVQELAFFVERAYETGKRLVGQLASIYCSPNKKNELYVQTFQNVRLNTVYDHIAELLAVFVSLDELILSNPAWSEGFSMYLRMISSLKHDPSRFETDEDDLWQLNKKLLDLKSRLFEGRIYQNFIEADFEEGVLPIRQNAALKRELKGAVDTLFAKLQSQIATPAPDNQSTFLKICVLFVFFANMFKASATDPAVKQIFEKIWNFHTQIPAVHIYLDVLWFSTDFLKRSAAFMMSAIKKPELANASLRQYTLNLGNTFPQRVRALYLQVCLWMVRTESNLTNRASAEELINARQRQLTSGLSLAYQASLLFKETWFLHLTLGAPFKPALVPYLVQTVEMVKAIQATFHRRSALFGEAISFICEQMGATFRRIFDDAQKRVSPKQQSNMALDVIAALQIAKQMLSGPPTRERRVILKLSLHIILQASIFTPEQLLVIKDTLRNYDMVADFYTTLAKFTDCSFLYWARDMIAPYFQFVYDHPHLAHKAQYFTVALSDVLPLLQMTIHVSAEKLIKEFKEEATTAFDEAIIKKLCLAVEKDLREHTHSHLGKIADRNPFKTPRSHIEKFFEIKPLLLLDKNVHVKTHVVHYLDKIFYDLPAINIKNWKVYSEMRSLAKEKYNLDLMQVDLAGETAEQDIDLLEIMRGIRSFTAFFHYNINNQIFIERTTEENIGKSMKCINTSDISNSIRRHGTGIITTSVNFIYLFIREKFGTFSQFLFDDYIRSPLLAEITEYEDNKKALNNRYPWNKALELSKKIKQLGSVTSPTGEKLTFLDQFRMLITHMGNAMGYIRMIRSGGFKFVSNAIKYIPDLKDLLLFEQLVKQEHLSDESHEASRNLDLAIDTLVSNFAEGTEYFSLLVKQFAGDLRSPENVHLKNFYILVPALMVNFVEYILAGKNKLLKKRPGGFFTDDGFAIGVAYILQVLGQFPDFDSLHWWEEVDTKTRTDLAKVKKQIQELAKSKKEDKETIEATLKNKQDYADEFTLLQYSFSGARIFFKQEKHVEEEIQKAAEGKEEEGTQEQGHPADENNNNNNSELGTGLTDDPEEESSSNSEEDLN